MRVGHPARLVEAVQKHSLDALLSRLDSASILSDVRGDLEAAMVCEVGAHHLLRLRSSLIIIHGLPFFFANV